jgi:PAS domain S-box-containing protein
MFAIAIWSLAYGLELVSQDLFTKMLWIKIEYVGIVATPLLWLVFALQYTGQGRLLSRRNIAILALVPLVTLFAVWTNEMHHLHYRVYTLEVSSGWPLLHIEYGPTFWINTVFAYLCLLIGTLLLAGAFFRSSALHRQQAGVLLAGALIPWVVNAFYLTGYVPWSDFDPTPVAFTLTGVVVAFGLFRYGLLKIVPVAIQTVVEGMPAAMVVLDAEGYIADLNPAAKRLFDLTDRQAIGQPARQVLRPKELVARFADAREVDTEIAVGEGDDRQVYRITISPLDDWSSGTPSRLILISDITAQVAAQEALTQRNRQLALLHNIARVAASTLEFPDLYQALANTLAQIIGGDGCYITRLDEKTGQVSGGGAYGPLHDSYHSMQPPPGELTLTESVLKAGRPLPVEDVHNSPYLSPRIAEMFPAHSQLGLPLRVGERSLGAVLIAFSKPHTFTDEEIAWATQAADLAALALENSRLYEEVKIWATELEQRVEARTRELEETQAQLLHAEKLAALGRLSAGIAHEIGQPLNLIQGYVELLAEGHPDLPYLQRISHGTQQLIDILAQLRSFSRPASEEQIPVAINELVDRVLTLASQELNLHQVQISTHLATDLPQVQADAGQLEQVFLNLVLNACDAMPTGGEIQVRTHLSADQLVIEFTDTGTGIPPENLKRIFEPYFTTKEAKGTGLGLAICQRIVEAHGGQINVTSQPGQGTTFQVNLPVEGATQIVA